VDKLFGYVNIGLFGGLQLSIFILNGSDVHHLVVTFKSQEIALAGTVIFILVSVHEIILALT